VNDSREQESEAWELSALNVESPKVAAPQGGWAGRGTAGRCPESEFGYAASLHSACDARHAWVRRERGAIGVGGWESATADRLPDADRDQIRWLRRAGDCR
jgi:hypothetical protein